MAASGGKKKTNRLVMFINGKTMQILQSTKTLSGFAHSETAKTMQTEALAR